MGWMEATLHSRTGIGVCTLEVVKRRGGSWTWNARSLDTDRIVVAGDAATDEEARTAAERAAVKFYHLEALEQIAAQLLDARAGGTWETLTADLDALHGAGVTLADIAQAVRDDLGEA